MKVPPVSAPIAFNVSEAGPGEPRRLAEDTLMGEMWNLSNLTWILGAYLLGSVPFGLLLAKARGVDLRAVGSGNIGATNAMRALGKPLGLLSFALDLGKGFVIPWWLLNDVVGGDLGLALAAGVAAAVGSPVSGSTSSCATDGAAGGIEIRSASTSCDIDERRTFVSSSFSRRTRTPDATFSAVNRWSAKDLRTASS